MNRLQMLDALMPHLLLAPIALPMATAALLLLIGDHRRKLGALMGLGSCVLGLLVSVGLLDWVQHAAGPLAIGVYLPANWPVPYGIVLVVDRLSAMMLLLTSVLGLAAMLYALARWDRAGVKFHPLFQLQLMGIQGAFLTADLFNLFVFFEIMLAASYGLLLHSTSWARVRSGLHYLAINLVASFFLLIGIAILYGITGTLNMADMAGIASQISPSDRGLLRAGAAILAVAFLIKAAVWPLGLWLAPAYASAAAPAAAIFAVLTKLGAYAILRVWTLLFAGPFGATDPFGGQALVVIGLLTIAFGTLGILATQHLGRMAGFCAIVSSGTLLAAMGFAQPAVTGGALYYILGSTLAISALFLLAELIDRARQVDEELLLVRSDQADPFALSIDVMRNREANLDDEELALVGLPIPGAVAFLGLAFMACGLTIAGLPPFSGFVGKVTILSGLLLPASTQIGVSPSAWVLLALLMFSGLLILIAFSRTGSRYIWAPVGRPTPRLRIIETVPISALLLLVGALVWQADAVLRYANAAAAELHQPLPYISAVMSAHPVPPPRSPETRP